jgi:hypothetical protein
MNKLKSKAIKFLIEKQEKNGNISEIKENEQLFKIAMFLAKNNKLEETKRTLKYTLKYQTRKGYFEFKKLNENVNPICFLKAVTIYLFKNNEKKEMKEFIKAIKRSLNYIENNFDETYLLVYEKDEKGNKIFKAKDNAILLSILDWISQLLNEHDFHKEADLFFMLKGKIELGFHRYFWQTKSKVLVKEFIPKKRTYSITNITESLIILENYNFDHVHYKKILKQSKSELNKETNIIKTLLTLIAMKKNKDKTWEIKFNKIKNNLNYFPTQIISSNKYGYDIEKSLFFFIAISVNKELKKEKIVLVEINNIQTALLILKLLEDE